MGRTAWRCRNRGCPVPHGAVLGTLTRGGDLELATGAAEFAIQLVLGRATVRCPACGRCRDFRGGSVYSARIKRVSL